MEAWLVPRARRPPPLRVQPDVQLDVVDPVRVVRRQPTGNVRVRIDLVEGAEAAQPEQLAAQSVINNQGRGEALTGAEAERVLEILKGDAARSYDHYEEMISDEGKQGLARELARMNLPANIYTQWYWKVDLHNLLHFLRLRADSHAQYEIRVYADEICKLVADWVPFAFKAFEDYPSKL